MLHNQSAVVVRTAGIPHAAAAAAVVVAAVAEVEKYRTVDSGR